jgi:hypothetical protein
MIYQLVSRGSSSQLALLSRQGNGPPKRMSDFVDSHPNAERTGRIKVDVFTMLPRKETSPVEEFCGHLSGLPECCTIGC